MRPSPVVAVLAALIASAASAQAPPVEEVVFRGNDTFDDRALSVAIATNDGECRTLAVVCAVGLTRTPYHFDQATLDADVLRLRIFYFERGFREAEVEADTVRVDDGVEVVFRIREKRPVRVGQLEVDGLEEVPVQGATRGLPMREGSRFDIKLYEATRDTLAARLQNEGYPRVVVLAGYDLTADRPYEASVSFTVHPGTRARIGTIDVVGARELRPRVIRRMLRFSQGDLYRSEELLESQRDLYQLDIFRHTEIRQDLDAEPDSLVPITVQVNEGDVRRLRAGVGINEADCASVDASWENRNFLGRARRLEVRGRVNNIGAQQIGGFPCGETGEGIYDDLAGQLSIDFSQPFFFGPRNTVGAGLFVERRSVPDVFVRTGRGGFVSFTRDLGSGSAVTLSYRPERTKLDADDVFFCFNTLVCDQEDIRDLRTSNWLSPVALSFTRDRSDAIFSPTRGHVLRFDVEHAAGYTGSRFAYTRWIGEGSLYRGVGSVVVAARIRGGVAVGGADGDRLGLNPQKRFFAGGPSSVRGFRQFELGPKVLFVQNPVLWLLSDSVDVGGDDSVPAAACTPDAVNDGTCDVRGLTTRAFDIRPTGGQVVLEANLELRMPSPVFGDRVRTAAFVDIGQVWNRRGDVDPAELIATPGFGVRYESPVGPIRLDLAYNTQGAETLRVLTSGVEACDPDEAGCTTVDRLPQSYRSSDRLITLAQGRSWDPVDSFWDRLQIHFSIGQAF